MGILIASFIAIVIFKKIVLIRLRKWSAQTVNTFDDFLIATIEKSVIPLLYITVVNFAIKVLVLPAVLTNIIDVAFLFAVTYFILQIISAVIKNFVFSFLEKQEDSETKEKQVKGMLIIINVVIWLLGILFLISNLGYNVTTIITGLGIGGIAIALAAQTILGDLFSYFIIFFDQPFEIGDFIIVEEKMGVIEYVGIKTTRLRTLSGEQLICSNTYLTSTPVHNYKRMEQRRIVFNIGVVYQTPYEQLKQIPEMINDIIRSKADVRFDRGHFSGFGDSSLDFEFVFYVESREYNFYMDRQQEIYFDIFAAFAARGIEFAYPTRTLWVSNTSTAAEGAGNDQPSLDNNL
ncbi:hypothetical protein GCM10027049_09260 [Mucilaginibacter puniceus]